MPETLILRLLVGAGLGFVVGLERQLHVRVGEAYAGARTFALIGVWGVATASLAEWVGPEAFVAGLVVFGAVEVASYLALSKKTGDVGTTTEMAALATFFVGVLAARDAFEVAAALAVGMAVLLRSKEYLRSLAGRFEQEDVAAVLQFGVVTAVILPLAPDRGFGPLAAINPHEIWLMVVLVSAIGLAGYLALRLLGSRGLGVTGLLGGLISSTAVTMSFSKMARRRGDLTNVLAAGVLGASGLMFDAGDVGGSRSCRLPGVSASATGGSRRGGGTGDAESGDPPRRPPVRASVRGGGLPRTFPGGEGVGVVAGTVGSGVRDHRR